MTTTPRTPSYAGYRFPAEVISYAVYLYFRFPLSLRMVEEMLAVRGIEVSHETVRKWGLKFGREIANGIRRRRPRGGDKWHLDEMVITIAGKKHYLWRAVDQGDVPAHVANGRALLINDYAASPVQARPPSLVAGAERAA